MNYKGLQLPSIANYKKLLNLLSRIELTPGFSGFLGELRQTKSFFLKTQATSSLTPPKHLLMQLYLNDSVFSSQAELEYVRDVFLEEECDAYQISKMIMDSIEKPVEAKHTEVKRQMEAQQSQDELEAFLESVNEVMLKIFQQYCSFGDPLNTDKLKSNKLVKLLGDLGVLSQT